MLTEKFDIGLDGQAIAKPVWFSKFWQAVEKFGKNTNSKLVDNEDWAACANRYSNALNISYVVFWVSTKEGDAASQQCFSWKTEGDKSRFVVNFS